MEWLVPNESSNIVRVSEVLYVSVLTCGLFSISQATRKEFAISFKGEEYHIYQDIKLIKSAFKVNNIYILGVTQLTANIATLIQQNIRVLTTSLMFNEEVVKL